MKDVGQEETIIETPVDKDSKVGNQVWYEYGCVWSYAASIYLCTCHEKKIVFCTLSIFLLFNSMNVLHKSV